MNELLTVLLWPRRYRADLFPGNRLYKLILDALNLLCCCCRSRLHKRLRRQQNDVRINHDRVLLANRRECLRKLAADDVAAAERLQLDVNMELMFCQN